MDMSLKEATEHIKKMKDIFKAFSKAEEVLKSLSRFGALERDSISRIKALDNAHRNKEKELEELDTKLLLKKDSVGGEMAKIDEAITKAKEEMYSELNESIESMQSDLTKLKYACDVEALRNKELTSEGDVLEVKVKTLRQVISDISSVKGVA